LPKVKRKKRVKIDTALSEKGKSKVRRGNNRQAAQNLRDRKRQYEEGLAQQARDLEMDNLRLEARVKELSVTQSDYKNKIHIFTSVIKKVGEIQAQQQQEDEQEQGQKQQQEEQLQQQQDQSLSQCDGSQSPLDMPSPVPQSSDMEGVELPSPTVDAHIGYDLFGSSSKDVMTDLSGIMKVDEDLFPSNQSLYSMYEAQPPLTQKMFNGDEAYGRDWSIPEQTVFTNEEPMHRDMQVSENNEASFKSAALKREPLPSELPNLSYAYFMMGVASFLQSPLGSSPSSPTSLETPLTSSQSLDALPFAGGRTTQSSEAQNVSAQDTAQLQRLLALVDPSSTSFNPPLMHPKPFEPQVVPLMPT